MKDGIKFRGIFEITCKDPSGNVKWMAEAKNTTVNVGIDYILGILLNGDVASDPWYAGLTDGTPTTDSTDTMGSHTGWAEVTAYDEAARQEFVDNAVSGQSVDNSGTLATYNINASVTIGGAFLVDDSTVGGTAGTLLCVSAFGGGDRSAASGDTIEVQYTFSGASA